VDCDVIDLDLELVDDVVIVEDGAIARVSADSAWLAIASRLSFSRFISSA
jgi:hypothetical protein